MKGISAVIATILMLMITIGLAGTAYMYVSGVFTARQRVLSVIDSWCTGTNVTAIIRNDGPDTIRAEEQTFVSVSEACTEPTTEDIEAGRTRTYTFTGCTGAPRYHRWRLVGPANTAEISVYCS